MRLNGAGRAVFGPRTSPLYKGATVPHRLHAFTLHFANFLRPPPLELFAPSLVAPPKLSGEVLRRRSAAVGPSSSPSSRFAILPLLRGAPSFSICISIRRRRSPLRRTPTKPRLRRSEGLPPADPRSVIPDLVLSSSFCSSGCGSVFTFFFFAFFLMVRSSRRSRSGGNCL